jgi:hypothetical protein
MKATNKIAPALLTDPDVIKIYRVTVDLGNNRWIELNFTEKTMATDEYNRIKGQGIYCGSWIKSIEIKDTIL